MEFATVREPEWMILAKEHILFSIFVQTDKKDWARCSSHYLLKRELVMFER